ncbi:MAG TPA: hypothetical protein VKI65_13885, partial [Gemmataceae bacterium]|nr:hypothetical protein [Gemmataceae bacterium]
MRHIRFARNLLVLGGAVCACAAGLGIFPLTSAGGDSPEPLEELAFVLKTSVRDPSSKEELNSRESAIKKQVDALRTVGDMRRALALPVPSWRDTDPEPKVADVDRRQREALATRLEAAVRKRLSEGDTHTRQATAVLIGEMGVSVRAVGTRGNYARTFVPDLAKLVREGETATAIVAARALSKIHPDPAIAAKALAERFDRGTPAERRAAAEALVNVVRVASQLPTSSTVAEVMADPLDVVRAAEAVVPVAAAQLRAADVEVRGRALEAIQLAGTTLADKVKDPGLANEPPPTDQEVQEERKNLQPLADVLDQAAPAVAGQLRARELEIRVRAARALEEIGRGWLRLQRRAASVAGGGKEEATGPAAPRGIAASAWAFLVSQRRANPRPIHSLPKGLTAAL